jgi:hypothetical protein
VSRLAVAALVLLFAVFGLLGAATWNRGGRPQFITLTERELALPWTWENGRDDDDAELRLRFEWERRTDPQDARAWLPDGRLGEIGFDMLLPIGAPAAADFYGRMLPRLAWAAFELDGPAWRAIVQRRSVQAAGAASRFEPWSGSRLVPIDVARDAGTLRRRYEGQQVIVMPVVVQVRYENRPGHGPVVWGLITRLVSDSVSVPPRLRSRLAGLPARMGSVPPEGLEPESAPQPPPPRYEVELGVGRLGAPWMVDVRRIE